MGNLLLNRTEGRFDDFLGKMIEQMPRLIKEGRVPLSVHDLMVQRLDVLEPSCPEKVQEAWWVNYFDMGDAVVYDTEGNVKVVLDAPFMREINAESKLSNGALILPEGTFKTVEGPEFTKKQVEKYTEKRLQQGRSIDNPFWRALARDDKDLLSAYDAAVFERAKTFGYQEAMGVYLSSPQKTETSRLWCVGNIYYGLSNTSGVSSLGSDGGRLVGVAPEAQAQKIGIGINTPSLDQILTLARFVSPDQKTAFEQAVREYYKK